jgi:hypothetical protein
LVAGFVEEVWRASNAPHAPVNQSTTADHNKRAKPEPEKERPEEAIARYNWWLTLFTAILAVSTVILGLATVGLYLAGERQLRHVQKEASDARERRLRDKFTLNEQMNIARQSAKAAQKAADASAASAAILIDAQRPWVGLVTIVGVQIRPGLPIEAKVVIQNTGHTPARCMRVMFRGSITAATAATGAAPEAANLTPQKALFPNVPDFYYPFHGSRALTDDDFRAIVQGTRILWVVGRIEYLDNRGIERWTDICVRWDQSRGEYVPNLTGNDAT